MIRYVCRYADGAAGWALLSLRLRCRGVKATLAATVGLSSWPTVALLGTLLLIGLAAPVDRRDDAATAASGSAGRLRGRVIVWPGAFPIDPLATGIARLRPPPIR